MGATLIMPRLVQYGLISTDWFRDASNIEILKPKEREEGRRMKKKKK